MPFLHNSFSASALYQQPAESLKGFLSKRWSFWLALFSCIAFLVGNMVGQHGFSAFWQSVWGQETAIVYNGVVPPLAGLPEYQPHRDCRDIREYDRSVYSIQYMGDYDSGGKGCGSHLAADILAKKGTPSYAIANGRISRKEERSWGFGNTLVLEFPGPDPEHPSSMITLYAGYAHMGQMLVDEGEVVYKGQLIGYTGETGFATAAHLHFQIDREKSLDGEQTPFHPYWPFTTSEASKAGYSFVQAVNKGLGRENALRHTIDPLAYVDDYSGFGTELPLLVDQPQPEEGILVVALDEAPAEEKPKGKNPALLRFKAKLAEQVRLVQTHIKIRRADRLSARQEKRKVRMVTEISPEVPIVQRQEEEVGAEEGEVPVAQEATQVAAVASQVPEPTSTAPTDIPMSKGVGNVTSITMLHDGEYGEGWEEIVLFARDAEGHFMQGDVTFEGALYLEDVFGTAKFSPSALTSDQFDERGRAFVRVLAPKGGDRKTIVPKVFGAFTEIGEPLMHEGQSTVSVEVSER
jgi:hypothetical protein